MTRSVRPLVPSVNRRLKSTRSEPRRLALNPTAALDAQNDSWKMAMSSKVTAPAVPVAANGSTRTRGESMARRPSTSTVRLNVGHAHVGAQGVKHQVRQVGLLPGLDVAGQHCSPFH